VSTIRPIAKTAPHDRAHRRVAANWFRSARCVLGLSCDEIAAAIGWSPRAYLNWETGRAAAPTDAYFAVRALLAEHGRDSSGKLRVG